jgi:hypothetical protein
MRLARENRTSLMLFLGANFGVLGYLAMAKVLGETNELKGWAIIASGVAMALMDIGCRLRHREDGLSCLIDRDYGGFFLIVPLWMPALSAKRTYLRRSRTLQKIPYMASIYSLAA